MDLGLTGRRAAVAAASAGLGYAVANTLAAEGARVVICGHDRDRIECAAARIGNGAIGLVVDLSSPDACAAFVERAQQALGGLDILVTNAPGPPAGNFATTPTTAFQAALELNLLSVMRMCYAAVPAMQQQGWGRVVAITSLSVRQPIPSLILSNTARAGATGFLKTLAREVAGDGVTVNSVQPGLHATDRINALYGGAVENQIAGIPAGTVGRAEDFGAAVAFLCSDQARYITGSALPIDGGADHGLQ